MRNTIHDQSHYDYAYRLRTERYAYGTRLITGPPTQCRRVRLVTLAGVCCRLSWSVTPRLAYRRLHPRRPCDDVMPPAIIIYSTVTLHGGKLGKAVLVFKSRLSGPALFCSRTSGPDARLVRTDTRRSPGRPSGPDRRLIRTG